MKPVIEQSRTVLESPPSTPYISSQDVKKGNMENSQLCSEEETDKKRIRDSDPQGGYGYHTLPTGVCLSSYHEDYFSLFFSK